MTSIEIISLVVTIICLVSFCIVFTFLFRHYYISNINEINNGHNDVDLLELAKEEEIINKSKKKRVTNIISKVISYTLLSVVLIGFGISVYSRFANNNLLFGNEGYVVISSGSMSKRNEVNTYLDEYHLNNQFNTYDIINIRKYNKQEDVKLYDVIAFKGDDGNIYVHRIISIDTKDNTYITRGDSNSASDPNQLYKGNLTYNKIIGYYTDKKINTLGIFVIFLQSNSGIITIVSIIYCVIMFDHFRNKYDKAIEERTNKLIELLEYNLSEHKSVDFSTKYHETLIYKGNKYIFENGNFISKSDLEESDLVNNEDTSSSLVVIKDNNDEESNVTIKNINTNKEDTFKEKKSNVFSKIKDFFRKDKSKENKETKETNNDNLSEM